MPEGGIGPESKGPSQGTQGGQGKVDAVAVLYILGGIPAIVAYVVILFTLVHLFPSIPG